MAMLLSLVDAGAAEQEVTTARRRIPDKSPVSKLIISTPTCGVTSVRPASRSCPTDVMWPHMMFLVAGRKRAGHTFSGRAIQVGPGSHLRS